MDGSLAERLRTDEPAAADAPTSANITVRRITRGSPPRVAPPTRQATLRPPMEKFVIEGGVPLSGTIVPAGNKNGALPILAACLLTEEPVILRNVPRISDVRTMTQLLQTLGADVHWNGGGELQIDAANVSTTAVDRNLSERIRASFLLAGPLLARFGKATMPPPGGDVIGRRRLAPHLDAFKALGADVDHNRDIHIEAPCGLQACDFLMDE